MTKTKQVQKLFESITWPYNSIHNSILIDFDEDDAVDTKLLVLRDIKEQLDSLYQAYDKLDDFINSEIEQTEHELYHN